MNRLPHFNIVPCCLLVCITISIRAQQNQIDSLTSIFNTTKKKGEKLESARLLISAYRDTNRVKAIHYAEEAIKLAKTLKEDSLLGKLYLRTGRLWEKEDSYALGIEYYQKTLKLGKKNKDKPLMAYAYYRIGNAERKLSEYQSALTNCFKSEELSKEIKDSTRLAWNYNCFGTIYRVIKEYNKAIDYYTKSIEISKKLNDNGAMANVYNNIGIVYKNKSEYKLAKEFYLKALTIRVTETDHRANSLNNLANAYIMLGDFSEAKNTLEEAFKIRLKLNNKAGLASSYYMFGKYYDALDSLEQAKKNLFISLEIATDINIKLRIKNIYSLLYQIFDKEQNYKAAFEYYKKYKKVYDDIYNVEKSKHVNYHELVYKSEILKEKQRITRLKQNFIIGSILIFVIIVIVFRLIQRKNHLERERLEKKVLKLQKEQIETKLDTKNKELNVLSLTQASINGIIERVKKELTITKYNLKKENQKPIQSIIDDLSRNLKPNIWEEFELRFVEVHKDFYAKLISKFPSLTSNEQRLCALLRLNMSSKEISALTNQSVHSIEIARGRLRKKLNLVNKNTSIVNFLSNL